MKRRSQPPGFRFQPTHVELVMFYLKKKVLQKKLPPDVISELDIYKYAPWDLPAKSRMKSGDLKWYFFCPREKKYASGARMNRATDFGFWKSTGKDRPVVYFNEEVGQIKTLTFFRGKAPKGEPTDWVMHEYRIEQKNMSLENVAQNAYVLCVIFQKDGPGPRNGAQYGAPFNEEDWNDDGLEEVGSVEVDHSTSSLVLHNKEPLSSFAPATSTTPSNIFGCSSISYISENLASTSKEIPQIASFAPVPQNLEEVGSVEVDHSTSPLVLHNKEPLSSFAPGTSTTPSNIFGCSSVSYISENLASTSKEIPQIAIFAPVGIPPNLDHVDDGFTLGDIFPEEGNLNEINVVDGFQATVAAANNTDQYDPICEYLEDIDTGSWFDPLNEDGNAHITGHEGIYRSEEMFPTSSSDMPYMELDDLNDPLYPTYQDTQMLNDFYGVNEQQYIPFSSFDAIYDPGYAHMPGSSQFASLQAPNHSGFDQSVNIPPNSNEGYSNGYNASWPDHDWNPP